MKKDKKLAQVFHYDLYGKRAEKYDFLSSNSLQTVPWRELELSEPQYFFTAKDFSQQKEYEKGFSVQELFPVNSVGIVTAKDAVFVNADKKALLKNVKDNLGINPDENLIQNISYRPFDNQYIYYDTKRIERARESVMQHFLKGENVGLVTCRQAVTNSWELVNIIKNIVDDSFVSNRTKERGYVFPLYLYPENDKLFANENRKPNLNETIIKEISQRLGAQFAPINILDYIYAALHSPAYRERYKEFLKIDFPRVPYPQNATQFWRLVELGGKLRQLHLMENVEPQEGMANFPVAGSNKVEKPQYISDKVYINETQYFEHVPLEAWNFYIGGYQPAQKWLKDRKGGTLGYDDIRHYQRIIRVLKETGEVMREVDGSLLYFS